MCIDEKQVGQIINRLENVEETTKKVEESIYGNGKSGLLERTGRIELNVENVLEQSKSNANAIEKVLEQADSLAKQALKQASQLVEKTETKSLALIRQVANENMKVVDEIKEDNTKIINEIKAAIEEIRDSVKEHHNNKELHSLKGLVLRREVFAWVVLGVLVIHALIPKEFDVWELIKHFLGL